MASGKLFWPKEFFEKNGGLFKVYPVFLENNFL
jgi:hypothetical protein